jgi:ABC-type branched-subunit amino acid transport system substrate-binding protein
MQRLGCRYRIGKLPQARTIATQAAVRHIHLEGIMKLRHSLFVLTIAAFTQAAFAAEPIKIGVSIAESPPGSVAQGTQVKDGLEVAKDMINKAGGVLGRPLQLIIEDDQGLPEKGRAAVEKLITKDHVVAITGTHQSSVCLAEIEVAHRHNVPFVNTNCWSDAVRTKGYKQVFNPGNYNSRVAAAMAQTIKAMGVKSVVAFAENTDYGIGQAKDLGAELKKMAPDVKYKYETLDRAGKDFTPAVLPLRANPPGMVVTMMLPPAAYILVGQLYQQGVAPSAKTWLYDGAGIGDYPDFWRNVKQAGQYMIEFGLYHPDMKMPKIGHELAALYQKRTGNAPNRLLFQAADSLLMIADAIKEAKSTQPDAMIKAMETTKFHGYRGTFEFSSKPGYTYHQWIDVPYVNYQFTAANQPVDKATLIQGPGQQLDVKKLVKPAS